MAFIDQVQDLTSLSASDTDELSQFLKDGVIDVTNRWLLVRPQDIDLFIRVSGEQTANDSLALNGVKIINVVREDGTNNQWRNCRKISPALQYDVTDVDSLNYASKINPAYTLLHNGKVNVFPSAAVGGANSFKVYYVNNEPTDLTNNAALIHSHSDIQYFPADKVYLVVMYAGMKLLQANMGATTITDLSVTAVPPDVPTITASTVSFGASVPTYSTPAQTISGTNWATAYPDEYSAINTALAAIATEVGLAKTEVAEIVTQTDGSSDFATALTAMNGELDKADDIIVEASAEFDEAKNLSEAYSSGKVKDALYAMSTELNKADGIIANADTAIGRYYTDIADIDDTTELWDDTNKRFAVVRDALNYAGNLIDGNKPNQEYDAAQNLLDVNAALDGMQAHLADGEAILTNDPTSGAILTALDQIKSNVDLANGVIDSAPVPPDTPTLSSTSIAAFSVSVPAYTAPTVTAGSTELTEMEALTGDALGTDADFYDFEKWFTALGEMIEDEEDTELAQAQIGKISTYIQAYGQAMQNQLNIFNDANVEFQADIQRKFKEADFDNQEDARLLQKYSAEVQEYQAEVGAQVQEYTQKLQRYQLEVTNAFQAWQKTESDSLQEYQLNIQNELNEFNMENADFQLKFQEVVQEAKDANQVALQNMQKDLARAQADAQSDSARRLQDAIQSMQDDVANNASLIQKFQTEITEYQAEVNAEVQEYQANWNKQLQEWSGYQKTVLQHYQIEIQNELNDFNKENARYQANIQATIAKFQVDAAEAQKEGDLTLQATIQDYTQELALFNGELQKYQTEVQSGVQTMQGTIANNQALLTKYQAETVEYQAEVAAETQEQSVKMQQYQLLYNQLKAEYDQAFMIAAPKQQAEA